MKSRTLHATSLSLALLALTAFTQSPAASAAQVLPGLAYAAAPAAAGAGKSHRAAAHRRHTHHAPTRHRSHAMGHNRDIYSAGPMHETAYQAALKRCVSGPSDQHDRCLDDAIARFGRQ